MPAASPLVTHASRRSAATSGFTLVELMVVVVIIGVVIAGMVLSIGGPGRDTQLLSLIHISEPTRPY